jgi:alkylation response protein AidB-like acyl-CoA dehydrogenase
MEPWLNAELSAFQASAAAWVDREIVPHANAFDEAGKVPRAVIDGMAAQGWLGANIPKEFGGSEYSAVQQGILFEEVGRGSASILSLYAVHGMLSAALTRWGSAELKQQWLPRLAKGEKLGAFALSEPAIGSDAANVTTRAELSGDHILLNGEKKWISYGQIADVFLVFANTDAGVIALLVDRETPGFSFEPITGMMGFQASQMATLKFKDCRVPVTSRIGKPGQGFVFVANHCLNYGRHCIAWGSVGVSRACLETSIDYARTRQQFGKPLKEQQLIQQLIADMAAQTNAARMACWRQAAFRDAGSPEMMQATNLAKYFAARVANEAADACVQIHGANGCSRDYPAQRFYRDAKVFEIIEGTNQIQQMLIAKAIL